ncbi:MAG: T9SS type A sorting domain-containing protein [Bacteroidetes bacterium]|nr:T9SS type A sorting domain-containing protein [Bacteroidota bacterium]MBU1580794.1 T9SS type A sorting domain-containing protein [Bacteroidota bacterium]MBU2464781.1 T9SS type A sorting domain-containing protein [Bacteroidota bacterium]MBU2558377.1 T9SS type A sorting domain-containing protein [Bacteroidota bacterium]
MKNIVTIIALLITQLGISQTFYFTYDLNGNMTGRSIIVKDSDSVKSNQQVMDFKYSIDQNQISSTDPELSTDGLISYQAFPNPAGSYVNIKTNREVNNATIKLIDENGKILFTKHYSVLKQTRVALDGIKVGTYFLEITTIETCVLKSIIKN